MPITQAENFISVLRAAFGHGARPLTSPDWDELAQLAQTQMLTALFYTGAVQYDAFSTWDPEKRLELQRKTITAVGAQAMRTQRFLPLYQALVEAGLRPLVLKGIICRNLYGDLADYRPSSDEDLYLPPEQIPQARAVLEREGWRLDYHEDSVQVADRMQEIAFTDAGGQLHLELHPTLFGTDSFDHRCRTAYFRGIEARAVVVEVDGVALHTLGYTDHYLYLFLHLAKHFSNGGVGVRQICDLMQFQRAYGGQIDWPEVRRAVQELSFPGLYADVVAIGGRLGFEADPMFPSVQADQLLLDSLEGGVYGHDREGGGRGNVLNVAAQYPTRFQRLQRLLFPSVSQLVDGRPWLKRRPWLLPVAWVQRAGLLFSDSKHHSRITAKALKSAYGRLELLRGYGMTGRTSRRRPGGKRGDDP